MITKCLRGFCVLLAGCLCSSAQPASGFDTGDFFPDGLVGTEVRATDEQDRRVRVSFIITHVYLGAADLLCKHFAVTVNASGEGGLGLTFHPPFREREQGIWLVTRQGDQVRADLSRRGPALIRLPARNTSPELRHAEVKRWAETVERIHKLRDSDRLPVLKQLVTDSNPESSAWAVSVLAASKTPDIAEFLIEVVDSPAAPVLGQMAADDALSEVKGAAWRSSGSRQQALARWLSSPRADFEAQVLGSKLNVLVQKSELDDPALLRLLGLGVAHRDLPISFRQNLIRLAGIISGREKDGENAFQYLLDQIQTAPDQELRMAAAHALKNFTSLNERKTARLRDVKDQLHDKKLADVLGEALEKAAKK